MTNMLRPSAETMRQAQEILTDELGGEKLINDPDLFGPYSEDYSFCGIHAPDLVVRASCAEDVQKVFKVASEHKIPVTPRGLGTGKSGGSLPIFGGIVLSLDRMNRMLEVNKEDMVAVAEPGIITADFMAEVEQENLFYPPDPNSLKICSLGGNVACNAGGPEPSNTV